MSAYSMGELDRRVGNVLRIGTVFAFDPAQGVKVDIGDLVTDWLPIGVGRAGKQRSWNPKSIGEQVLIAAPDGEVSQGVVVCSLPCDAFPENGSTPDLWRETFADGTVVEYDQATGSLRADVTSAGSITLHIGGTVLTLRDGQATLVADDVTVQAPQTTFTGNVQIGGGLSVAGGGTGGTSTITGNFNISGGGLTHNGKNIGSSHTHGGVQTGGGSTGAPN